MEIFLLILAKILLFASTCLSIFHFYRTTQRLDDIKLKVNSLEVVIGELIKVAERSQQIQDTQQCHGNALDRILESLKAIQEAQNPKSKTNWDNLKEAFKGPSRITINERD
ncbi:MAG: hypothetical protein PHS86_03220 [Syntrophaceae bacterium]|nr:hypothetical protein [Syntrophaceae bacterium]